MAIQMIDINIPQSCYNVLESIIKIRIDIIYPQIIKGYDSFIDKSNYKRK